MYITRIDGTKNTICRRLCFGTIQRGKNVKYFVGKMVDKKEGEWKATFLRRTKNNKLTWLM
jgi:hypothetical protein